MKVKNPERGQLAVSEQGRDKGCLYVVSDVQGGFVLVVDGVNRKLSNPKRKNLKHVRLLPQTIAQAGITYPWDTAFDNRTAHFLKTFKKENG